MVKICGLTRADEVEHAARAGADLLGFVLAASPRQVSWEDLPRLLEAIPPGTSARPVAVFVDPEPEEVDRALASGAAFVQLHGQETPEFCRRWPGRVIKALHVGSHADLERARQYSDCAGLLLDSARPGSGESWDWTCLQGFDLPYFLAGGLTIEVLPRAWQLLAPYGVDVSSALECAPGRKDPARVHHFIQAARLCA